MLAYLFILIFRVPIWTFEKEDNQNSEDRIQSSPKTKLVAISYPMMESGSVLTWSPKL